MIHIPDEVPTRGVAQYPDELDRTAARKMRPHHRRIPPPGNRLRHRRPAGPVNTGYLDPDTTDRDLTEVDQIIAATPFRRFGAPDDPARLIGWLVSDAGRWVVGQVIKSDGGFDLWR